MKLRKSRIAVLVVRARSCRAGSRWCADGSVSALARRRETEAESKEREGRKVATKLAPTAKAKAMCAKLEPPMNDCGVAWNLPCTAELSVFAESDFSVFEEDLAI